MLAAIASDVLRDIRQAKSEAKVSMKAAVAVVRGGDTVKRLAALQQARDDLCDARHIGELVKAVSEPPCVDVTLG
ncbi:TPA: hypothetical protein QDC20_003686 [Burkholderia aenigmatica]|uniref:hypothetical protein n=1 Tax=Burkholderia sp. AU45251 TaxID=3059204 RepID=UPI00264E7711|nr:hypothetical protein [Burkholderia sp. AU45251]HDR9481398.1 hypothetical protein [Burkholderia aenigmatica]MDN7513979.1 hypothetical protein [Burkholderia sp. AU45251]HDR9512925.1 hypothetical protein [Burkholderia aenigmatica]HDR9589769.1 hypothetical protein [Burkholderia aenigmatica]HDR9598226.1 hypothetical protein [Burkholderia aenigmatica]